MKEFFPALRPNDIYLDSAATTHKPVGVVETLSRFYSTDYGTVHRSLYPASLHATQLYQGVREKLAKWIGAASDEVIFTKGATEGLNLVVGLLEQVLSEGDVVALSPFEHHANYLPWLALQKRKGIRLFFFRHLEDYKIDIDHFLSNVPRPLKVISTYHMSNVTGVVNDLEILSSIALQESAFFVVDATQSMAHQRLSIRGVDFLVFSGHKMYGPTGIGALFGKRKHLEQFEPIVYGGDMVASLVEGKIEFQPPPLKFEPGTPPIGAVIGLGAALDFIEQVGIEEIHKKEKEVIKVYRDCLRQFPQIQFYSAPDSGSILTFTIEGIHPTDMALLLGEEGVSIRSGSLCALPALKELGVEGLSRISVGVYNDEAEVQLFEKRFAKVLSFLSRSRT